MAYVIDESGTIVTGWSGDQPITIQIPDGIVTIGNNALETKSFNLGTLTFPSTLKKIGNNAYSSTHQITGINISNLSELTIETSAFAYSDLTGPIDLSVAIFIGNNAFEDCSKINGDLNLSNTTNIGSRAFSNCGFNGTLTLPSSLSIINPYTFNNCKFSGTLDLSGLTQLNTIQTYAFYNNKFKNVIFPEIYLINIYPSSFYDNLFTNIYFQSNCNVGQLAFNILPDAVVYAYDTNKFQTNITSGYFTPTINPLTIYFRKWRLYDYPYPDTNSTFAEDVDYPLTLNYTSGLPVNFYTYTPVLTNYSYSIDDGEKIPITGVYTEFEVKFTITIDYGSKLKLFKGVHFGEMKLLRTILPCFTIIEPFKKYYFIGESMLIKWEGGTPPYNVELYKKNELLETIAQTDNKSVNWTVDVEFGIYKICITDQQGCTGCKEFLALPLLDICFVKDTLVETDQGDIPIQSLVVGKHTIFKQKIMEITTTIHIDSHLVRIAPFAFGTYPNKETIVSQEHKINGDNSFRKAIEYVNGTTVTLIPYEQEPLYNVVLIKHGFMKVHGMMVETLDPYVSKHRPKHPLQMKR